MMSALLVRSQTTTTRPPDGRRTALGNNLNIHQHFQQHFCAFSITLQGRQHEPVDQGDSALTMALLWRSEDARCWSILSWRWSISEASLSLTKLALEYPSKYNRCVKSGRTWSRNVKCRLLYALVLADQQLFPIHKTELVPITTTHLWRPGCDARWKIVDLELDCARQPPNRMQQTSDDVGALLPIRVE